MPLAGLFPSPRMLFSLPSSALRACASYPKDLTVKFPRRTAVPSFLLLQCPLVEFTKPFPDLGVRNARHTNFRRKGIDAPTMIIAVSAAAHISRSGVESKYRRTRQWPRGFSIPECHISNSPWHMSAVTHKLDLSIAPGQGGMPS